MSETFIVGAYFKLHLLKHNLTRENITQLNHTLRTAFKGNLIGPDGNYLLMAMHTSAITPKSTILNCSVRMYTSKGSMVATTMDGQEIERPTFSYGPGKSSKVGNISPTLFGAFSFTPVDEFVAYVRDFYNNHKK